MVATGYTSVVENSSYLHTNEFYRTYLGWVCGENRYGIAGGALVLSLNISCFGNILHPHLLQLTRVIGRDHVKK